MKFGKNWGCRGRLMSHTQLPSTFSISNSIPKANFLFIIDAQADKLSKSTNFTYFHSLLKARECFENWCKTEYAPLTFEIILKTLTWMTFDWSQLIKSCLFKLNKANSLNINQFWVEIKELKHKFTNSWAVDEFVCEFDFFYKSDQGDGQFELFWP